MAVQLSREFIAAGQELQKRYPDYNQVLCDAEKKRGLVLHDDGLDEINKLKAPEVAYDLALPENDAYNREAINGASGESLRDKIRRRHAQLRAQGTYQEIKVKPRADDADPYITQRRMDRKSGKRWR